MVWNYDGGILLNTNGTMSDGRCFRVSGRVTSGDFFDDLKRVDTRDGTFFRKGVSTVTTFPEHVNLAFIVYDHFDATCPPETGPRMYLTRELMSSMHMSLYWKRGIDLRPVGKVTVNYFSVDPVVPHTVAALDNLPQRYRWSYEFSVPSKDVPLTDSLVLVFRAPDDKQIALRVSARL